MDKYARGSKRLDFVHLSHLSVTSSLDWFVVALEEVQKKTWFHRAEKEKQSLFLSGTYIFFSFQSSSPVEKQGNGIVDLSESDGAG